MKVCLTAIAVCACSIVFSAQAIGANEALNKADQLEQSGDAVAAKAALQAELEQHPKDPAALAAYAEFLDRYHDRDAREAYRKLQEALPAGSDQAKFALRRLLVLDLVDGDREAEAKDLSTYQQAGGQGFNLPAGEPEKAANSKEFVEIPGPLRSFARMAAIVADPTPEDVLPAVARNVVTNGYQASRSNDVLEPTEYLKLLVRYVSQARELEKVAGPDKVIKIDNCESAQTGELLRIVGFRMRGGCGSEVVLETVNAARAFLTTDSGFPMSDLEQALRTSRPFTYDYHPSRVPVLYGPDYWVSAKERGTGDFLDAFLGDPSLCRFYLGMAKLDRTTADLLKANVAMPRLRAYAHVLDFFGGMFEIRNGRAVVPGSQKSAVAWGELAGVTPEKGPQFFEKILAKDDGWLASLYDSLARMHGPVQAYLTEPVRMKRFYGAVRGNVTSPGPARPVFRANADMMLLTTRLRLDPDGRPHIPGGISVWRELFVEHPHGKYDAKLTRLATAWRDPDDVLEALFALSRKSVENEPLKIFMALSDLDRYRTTPLQPGTVQRLARSFSVYGAQYRILTDSATVTDATISRFVDTMEALDKVRDLSLRSDAAGSMQALLGLWQIFSRTGALRGSDSDKVLAGTLAPFGTIRSERDVFVASRNGVKLLLSSTASAGGGQGESPQDRMLELLAGANDAEDSDAKTQLVGEMQRALEAQRIVSLTSILQVADTLEKASTGQPADMAQIQKISSRISEIQLPRVALSGAEKNALAMGYWTEKHVDNERKLNLRAVVEKAGKDPERLQLVEGALAPLLRDTLVAFNYIHYAPPGAQILYTNPLFVRGHDFVGLSPSGGTWKSTELLGTGWPSNGGGRLVGSLVNLPYALAEAEQNFLIPSQTQALIWGDLVPQMLLSAKLPRWWKVTSTQMHWVNLHMILSETLLAEAALSQELRTSVMEALRAQVAPNRMYQVNHFLETGKVSEAIGTLTPVEMYVMACSLESAPAVNNEVTVAEIRRIAAHHAADVSEEAISKAFGTPKPTLSNSYRTELLKLRTFPTLMGYSSRIMAESWESNTLYWAALGDQMHVTPGQLNILIPEWTEKVVERIFASHLEDWPALLRSLRTVGNDVRSGALVSPAQPAGI